jgi:cell division protein FtsZ
MTINLHLPSKNEILRPTITVIGVGGAGGNAVNNMIAASLEGVNFVVANTDAQALDHSLTERTIQLGAGLTKGLGAGANPEVGRAAAEEARDEISAYIEGSNMVFITAGMGGGTGTGAASVVARLAKEQGVLTVGVVTKPFTFEGTHRMKMAEAGLKELQEYVDTLIIIPNQNLFRIANERTTFADAFKMADEVLHSGVRGVTDLMVKPGLINLDFADIRSVMREMGKAMMGTGEASGDRRAVEAAEAAISNPLLDDVSLKGAKALLINITGGPDMTLFEVDEAANRVREEVDSEANIIFGSTFSDSMEGRMRVSVVATGIDAPAQVAAQPSQKYSMPGEPKKPFSFSSSAKAEPAKAVNMTPRVTIFDAPREAQRAYSAPQEQPREPQRVVAEQRPAQPVREPVRAERIIEHSPVQHQEPQPPAREPEYSHQYYEQEREQYEQEARMPALREAAAASSFAEPRMMPPVVSPRREARMEPSREDNSAHGKGFFQRVADVGRAISGKQEMGERIHVVQRGTQAEMAAEKAAKVAPSEEEQYLDIPAFLRRQAN